MKAVLDGEEKDDKAETYESIAQKKKLRELRREKGLNNLASIDIYNTWRAFNGPNASVTPQQAAEMEDWLREDFRFILAEEAYERDLREKKKANTIEVPSKRSPRRVKRR